LTPRMLIFTAVPVCTNLNKHFLFQEDWKWLQISSFFRAVEE